MQIEGGNRMNGWLSALSVKGVAFDPDINPSPDPTAPSNGITYSWQCKNLLTNSDCLNRQDQVIDMAPFNNQKTISLPASTFYPFNAYSFQLKAEKASANKKGDSQVAIIITEYDIPLLGVSMPNYLITKKINFNEDVFIDLVYDQNLADNLAYKLDIIYED